MQSAKAYDNSCVKNVFSQELLRKKKTSEHKYSMFKKL